MPTPQRFSSLKDPLLFELLLLGNVGIIPTDTVYGLVCCAENKHAVERLYSLKQREQKPGIIIAGDVSQLENFGIDPEMLVRAKKLWPGPISIGLEHTQEHIHQGTHQAAFRVVANEELKELLFKVGPLLTTSANLPGQPPAQTIQEAEQYFKENVDFYVDGGDYANRPSSTLIRFTEHDVEILRQGNISAEEIRNRLSQ